MALSDNTIAVDDGGEEESVTDGTDSEGEPALWRRRCFLYRKKFIVSLAVCEVECEEG